MKEARVLLGTPSGSTWQADFGMSLVGLMSYAPTPLQGWGQLQLGIDNPKGSILSRSRQLIVKRALGMDATHLLFIDSDMVFPPNLLHKLLEWDEQIVACNCATKQLPANPTARLKDDTVAGTPLYTEEESEGLKEVWRVGTGVMLVNMEVFEKIEAPYWEIVWKEEVNDYQGEDWTFCEKLSEAGIPLYVDQGMSRDIGHSGSLVYTHGYVNKPDGVSDIHPRIILTK